jgi:RNA polymerase sigma-70 factor (ECF subfamily)
MYQILLIGAMREKLVDLSYSLHALFIGDYMHKVYAFANSTINVFGDCYSGAIAGADEHISKYLLLTKKIMTNPAELRRITSNSKLIALWEQTITGDEHSFALIHKGLYPGLFSYAMKMLRDEKLVDDLLQDLFIKFWQQATKIGSIQNVQSYFYRSVRSLVLNHIKSASLKANKLTGLPKAEIEFSKEDIIISNEQDEELKSKLHLAVNRLPKKQRETVYLRFYENMEYVQIAEITGIKYQSVINHVYRAVQTLKGTVEVKQIYAA